MKKTENLVATLLAIYGILCAVSIALYALIQLFVDDKSTATNLLIWSATIFAPIAVLMTYTSWREQKKLEIVSRMSEDELNQIEGLMCKIFELENKFRVLLYNDGVTEKYKKEKIEFDFVLKSLHELRDSSSFNRSKLTYFLNKVDRNIQNDFFESYFNYLNILVIESDPKMMELMVKVDNERIRKALDELFDKSKNYKILLLKYISYS